LGAFLTTLIILISYTLPSVPVSIAFSRNVRIRDCAFNA
jgi:hypothetical protein